jgi:hypothetical protein
MVRAVAAWQSAEVRTWVDEHSTVGAVDREGAEVAHDALSEARMLGPQRSILVRSANERCTACARSTREICYVMLCYVMIHARRVGHFHGSRALLMG